MSLIFRYYLTPYTTPRTQKSIPSAFFLNLEPLSSVLTLRVSHIDEICYIRHSDWKYFSVFILYVDQSVYSQNVSWKITLIWESVLSPHSPHLEEVSNGNVSWETFWNIQCKYIITLLTSRSRIEEICYLMNTLITYKFISVLTSSHLAHWGIVVLEKFVPQSRDSVITITNLMRHIDE